MLSSSDYYPSQFPPSPSESSYSHTSTSSDGFASTPSPVESQQHSKCDQSPTGRNNMHIAHPYARIYAKKEGKRRRIWNHALEKSLFNAYELSTLGAPHRRTIYMASLEAHIDRLHAQLLSLGYWPIPFDELEPYRGLNSASIAQSMVSGLQHDVSHAKLKLLELERANKALRETLTGSGSSAHGEDQPRLLGLDIPSFSLNSGRH